MVQIRYPLTRSQRKVLEFVRRYIKRKKRTPTLREIAKGVGVRAESTVHEHLVCLQKKGYIKRPYNMAQIIILDNLDIYVQRIEEILEVVPLDSLEKSKLRRQLFSIFNLEENE